MEYQDSSVKINKGSIVVYRVFDLGEEVSLEKAESLITATTNTESRRLRLVRDLRNSLVIKQAPLALEFGEIELKFNDQNIYYKVQVSGKLWDYGAFSLCYQIPIPMGLSWKELIDFAVLIENNLEVLDEESKLRSQKFSQTIETAIKDKSNWGVFEDYTIYFLESLEGVDKNNIRSLIDLVNIPALIYAENKENLAEISHKILTENPHQYSKSDLVILDWNSALVIEPQGQKDVIDVIEFSLTHLLEMRYYDDLLDDRLEKLHDAIEKKEKASIFTNVYAKLSEESSQMYIEHSEFVEKVDNSLKTVGDFYLAVIFRSASYRFRFDDWRKSIKDKMDNLAKISELLSEKVNSRRSHYMELIVIILILGEILTAVIPWLLKGN